jgi:hypothetical protein
MDKNYDIVLTKKDEKIFAIVRGLCAHSGNWQEFYRQDITEAVSLIATAPQSAEEQNGQIAQQTHGAGGKVAHIAALESYGNELKKRGQSSEGEYYHDLARQRRHA